MINNKKALAIIPARGGSKGLPRKNILPLCDKPLINYTIEASLQSEYIDKVMVSTDDIEIAKISNLAGAEIPFLRPSALANDTASSIEVITHCLNWYNDHGIYYEYIILLQPTSPFRTKEDINSAFKLLIDNNAKAIVSVCESEHHPYWMNKLPEDHNMMNFENPEFANQGRQQLPTFYRLNGAIYLSEVNYFVKHQSFIGSQTFALIMDRTTSIDIDNKFDFEIAEYLLKHKKDN